MTAIVELEQDAVELRVGQVKVDANNPLPVDVQGGITLQAENLSVEFKSEVSTVNTTDVPLPPGGVFLGQWEEVVNYASITAVVLTDAASATNGAVAEFSADGINVIKFEDATVYANIAAFFSFLPQARYFRIRYTNGATAQTVLRAQVIYRFNPLIPQGPIGAQTDDLSLVQGTKSANVGRVMSGPFTGLWLPIGTDGLGNMLVKDSQAAAVTGHRFAPGKVTTAVRVQAVGNTTLVAPAADKKVRLHWIGLSTSQENGGEELVIVKWGPAGSPIYRWNMGDPGAFSHWETIDGPVGTPLIIETVNGLPVEVNYTYVEV